MAQVTAGEIVSLYIDDAIVKAKVEDASKSDTILAKVESSAIPKYQPGQVYEFDRALLMGA